MASPTVYPSDNKQGVVFRTSCSNLIYFLCLCTSGVICVCLTVLCFLCREKLVRVHYVWTSPPAVLYYIYYLFVLFCLSFSTFSKLFSNKLLLKFADFTDCFDGRDQTETRTSFDTLYFPSIQ